MGSLMGLGLVGLFSLSDWHGDFASILLQVGSLA